MCGLEMTRSLRIRVATVVLAVLPALVVGACGGSSNTNSTTVRQLPAARSKASQLGPTPCRAAGLALSFLGGQGATGHGLLGFALKNVSAAPCRTSGFPSVEFLNRTGRPLPTRSTATTHDFFGIAPKVRLVLAPGAIVSFRLGVTHGAASTAGCTTTYGLQAIPPGDTGPLRTTIRGGASECGTATVSPLRPGKTAY
jgi:Protein of unknown function (DUF4232)